MRRVILASVLLSSLLLISSAQSQTPPIFLTMWGSQGTGPGQFYLPSGVAVDPSGKV